MRGGFLPPAILIATLGLALAFIPLRRALLAAGVMLAVTLAAWWSRVPTDWIEPIFVGCWLSVMVTAGLVHRPLKLPSAVFLLAAANVGLWAGLVTSVAGDGRDLVIAVTFILFMFVGRPIVVRGWGIGVKVVASWLTAVAILATMVSLTPTPGYTQDHIE